MVDAQVVADPRHNLIEDMARDPEGHFHRSIGGDRRLPPWFGSDQGSLPPLEYQERLFAFLRDRCVGQPPTEFDIRHNWFDRQIEFMRWIPDFEPQDHDEKIALVTWTPLTLQVWPETQGWFPGGATPLFDYLWRCFLGHDAATTREQVKKKEIQEAQIIVGRLSSLVSQGVATDEQLEEYEHYLKVADPDGWQSSYELAEEMRAPTVAMMDEFGI